MGEYEAAKAAFQSCIEAHNTKPQNDACRGHFGYGSQLFRLGDPANAEQFWRDGLTKDCQSADATMQRGFVKLALGMADGWADMEPRRTHSSFAASLRGHGVDPKKLEPDWDGEAEGTVRVYGDQGAGDAILFSRWLRYIPNQYYLHVGEPLRRLLDGYAQPPRCDWSVPLSSLPLLLRAHEPFPPNYAGPWARPKNAKPRIGVCWKGSSAYLNDKDRSCPYDPRPHLTDYRWDLYSLQQGTDFDSPDYQWNANYLRTLDAVITVDTSTSHLAATLGVPTILIAQSQPFWYTGISGGSTPWYPSVQIVRRRDVNDWHSAWQQAKALIRGML
jgi:hypothetical protein